MKTPVRVPRVQRRTGNIRQSLVAGLCVLAVFGVAGFLAVPRLLPHPPAGLKAAGDAELYTGSIVLAPSRQDICRRLRFDNRSGRMQDNGTVPCGVTARADADTQAKYWTHNIQQVREGFRNR